MSVSGIGGRGIGKGWEGDWEGVGIGKRCEWEEDWEGVGVGAIGDWEGVGVGGELGRGGTDLL